MNGWAGAAIAAGAYCLGTLVGAVASAALRLAESREAGPWARSTGSEEAGPPSELTSVLAGSGTGVQPTQLVVQGDAVIYELDWGDWVVGDVPGVFTGDFGGS